MASQFGQRKPTKLLKNYLAIKLDNREQRELLARCPAVYDRIFAEHVTINFNPTSRDLDTFYEGSRVQMRVISEAYSDKAHAVRVSLFLRGDELKVRTDGACYHITVSVSTIGKPKDSNDIPDEYFDQSQILTPFRPFILVGTVELLPK